MVEAETLANPLHRGAHQRFNVEDRRGIAGDLRRHLDLHGPALQVRRAQGDLLLQFLPVGLQLSGQLPSLVQGRLQAATEETGQQGHQPKEQHREAGEDVLGHPLVDVHRWHNPSSQLPQGEEEVNGGDQGSDLKGGPHVNEHPGHQDEPDEEVGHRPLSASHQVDAAGHQEDGGDDVEVGGKVKALSSGQPVGKGADGQRQPGREDGDEGERGGVEVPHRDHRQPDEGSPDGLTDQNDLQQIQTPFFFFR